MGKAFFILFVLLFYPTLIFAQAEAFFHDQEIHQLEEYFGDYNIPKGFLDENKAKKAGCQIGFLKPASGAVPAEKSCLYTTVGCHEDMCEVLIGVVYDQLPSGSFVRRRFFTRQTKYSMAKAYWVKVFEDKRLKIEQHFIAVENERAWGTGALKLNYELIGWNGEKLQTVFKDLKKCHLVVPGSIEVNVDPAIFIPPDQSLSFGRDSGFKTSLILTYETLLSYPNQYTDFGAGLYQDKKNTRSKSSKISENTVEAHWNEHFVWDEGTFSFKRDARDYSDEWIDKKFLLGPYCKDSRD